MRRPAHYILLLYVVLLAQLAHAATIKGRITDEKNEPLSFVNVFIKGSNTATTCNEQGMYHLKLDAGIYEIGFQFIGYKIHIERIDVSDDGVHELNVSMQPESYALKEVNVQATAEDPAYPIMRQAMAMRKVYLFEPKEYQCNVYLKGMQRLTNVPKRVLLFKVPTDLKPGIVYLSESLSELSYKQPNQVKERMISSKVSGDNKAFSFNRAGAIKFNLYENNINSFGLNERGFVSPLASNAFLFYKYKLEGESKENGQTIYKIRLVPIREHDPVFRGHIYIVKDSWRLHSTDLVLNKAAQLEFVDTLYIKQVYAEQQGGVWMPVSQRFIFQLEAFGFRGNGYFVAVYSKYRVNSMYPAAFYSRQQQQIDVDALVPQVKKVPKARIERKKEKLDSSLFSKKHFNNEVLSIDRKANKTDDAIWDSIRPVPLTDEERVDYKEKDSVITVHESKPYMDSIDRINNRLDWSDVFVSGYSFERSYYKRSYRLNPIFGIVQYNTVEGWVLNPKLSMTKEYDDNRQYTVTPNLRYGFALQKLYGRIDYSYLSDPVKRTRWHLGSGYFVEQLNGDGPITPFINTVYTLFDERNFLKEYQKTFAYFSWSSHVLNGVKLSSGIEYAQRSPLGNHTSYAINNVKDREFSSNFPLNAELPSTFFSAHKALLFDLAAEFRFAQQYISRPDARYNFRSKYPVLRVAYRKGIRALGSAVNFDLLSGGVSYDRDFHLWGRSAIDISGGGFVNSRSMYFMDYQHFNGNRTILAMPGYPGFQLLDYYAYSTSHAFVEGHFNHHFNGFFINKLPLLRKLKWQEVVTMNYLSTTTSPHYLELGAGIEHIFKLVRVDFFTALEEGKKVRNGIVIGVGF